MPPKDFPTIVGLPNTGIPISDASRHTSLSPAVALGLYELPFIKAGPPICAAFSVAKPNGKKFESLSGSDLYNSLVRPLTKSFKFVVSEKHKPGITQRPIYPTLVMCLAVIDAPMLFVESPDLVRDPVLCPWVRVVRHETTPGPGATYQHYVLQIIHASYFDTYIESHLLPLATSFSDGAVRADNLLRFGGTVSDIDAWPLNIVAKKSNK